MGDGFYAGIDGCPAGWFYITLAQGGKWSACLVSTLHALPGALSEYNGILVDMPIGLRESGGEERACDRAARKVLGRARAASVFPVPVRATLKASTYEEAKAINRLYTGKGITYQTWNIMPKLREVDELMNTSRIARRLLREAHPEVCFWALNDRQVMRYNKKTPEGRREREAVLYHHLSVMPDILAYAANRYRRSQVGLDDILDASVLAVTALLGHSSLSTFPEEPELDARDLPMEIVYYCDKNQA